MPNNPRWTTAALASILLSQTAQAQLEEVIVTAQKKSANLQDVAIAVSAFSADTLRDAGIQNMTDITAMTPGFSVSNYNPTTPAPYIRGVGTNSSSVGDDASVGVFVDEVYTGRAGGYNADMFDVERVEVLRGPQGTLYGRNVAGGAMNIITSNPTDDLEGRVEVTAGDYGLIGLNGAISGPLSDNTRGRLALSSRQRDGWTTNITNGNELRDVDNISLRGKLDFDISDTVYLLLSADYSEDDMTGSAARATEDYLAPIPGEKTDKVSLNFDGFTEREIMGVSAKLEWAVAGGDLTSITAWRSNDYSFLDDSTGTWAIASLTNEANEESQQFSQELRFTQQREQLGFTVGAYFFSEDIERFETFDTSLTFGVPGISRPLFNGEMDSTSYSVFGEMSWEFSEKWQAILGGRYTWDEKEAQLEAADPDLFGFLLEAYDVKATEDWGKFTPKAGLEFRPNDAMLFFATWSEGHKAGGFNGLATNEAAALTPFDEETASNLEAGFKGDFFDQLLRVNASVFYTDYKDLQNFFVDFATAEVVTATADAEMQGLELELWWAPTDGLELFLATGWLDTEYTKFEADPSVEGNELMRAPEVTASGGFQYRWALGNLGEASIRTDITYTDSMFFSTANVDVSGAPSHTLVNARLGLDTDSGWNLALWGRNLNDETTVRHNFTVGLGDSHPLYGEPRMWGVSAAYSF
jgi:iron complex outermembrane recepter protein